MAEHDLVVDAIVLIRANTIPKTSSGKIQRSRLASMIQAGELNDRLVPGAR
jgi:acyl-coenzyme A synthetase/AMP-(fatty) acid ligase